MKRINNLFYVSSFLILMLITSAVISISIGPANISANEVLSIFMSNLHITDLQNNINPVYESIVLNIRLPRVCLAIITGMSLSVSGVILQALFRNPLADPYIIGVSSGAALGATIAIVFGFFAAVSIFGFIGAVITMILVYAMSKINHKVQIKTLLLSGVVVSAFFSAVITLIFSVGGKDLHQIIFWLMGNLSETNMFFICIQSFMALLGIIAAWFFARELNIISIGEESAKHLGVEVETLKKSLFVIAALMTGSTVAVTGIIGFVGLIVPHIMRLIVGPDHRVLIIASALGGGIFLTFSDLIARFVIAPSEIPVGVITAMLGGPFFLFLLKRNGRTTK